MPLILPDDLAPEAYPIAWLLGSWRGEGVLAYPGIEETAVVQTVTVDHDGGPYLRYTSTIRTLPGPSAHGDAPTDDDAAGSADGRGNDGDQARADAGSADDATLPVWSTETGYWRVPPTRPDGMPEGTFPLEVLLTDPAGTLTLYLGQVSNGRIDLASDLVARTTTAAEVTAAKRMYGLVEGRLLWVWELAALGHPLQSYVSASLEHQQ